MKRVAVIAIFMAVMASLFAFPVFADTPVQPLQVVTYSDTTTNVRISGTAERLHYNVDSFQVVFMNPPNNYGTACTPILVSFRFYNSSELPAYVGQAEFELTATTGTGSVNTIIYGYDQISTDLFVAESSYSTAEVGRIGIGASNDFAYYTGFVIPPKTSLYFSCIVYVNASAYGQNNTGATEDVNQVTLSSLNLYSNQISFSADYPYHNQPVDFSSIISAIEELNENVSTSSELQQLISYVVYNGPVYNGANTTKNVYNYSIDNVGGISGFNVRVSEIISSMQYFNDVDEVSSNDTLITSGYKRYYLTLFITVLNTKTILAHTYFNLSNVFPDGVNPVVTYLASDLFSNFYLDGRTLQLRPAHPTNMYSCVYPIGSHTTVIQSYIDVPIDSNLSFPIISLNNLYPNTPVTTDEYYPYDSYMIIRDLYLAYSSVNGLDDISNAADDISDKSELAHTIEQSYFTQNAQAIQQTGLSNYRFNGDQENGIGSVSHDFTLLWNALGGFNSIYIFSLTLSLALMILRHAPGVIRSSRRNKEE